MTADIYNLFNTGYIQAVGDVYGQANTDGEITTQENFEQPVAFTFPREVQLGLRYTF